MKTLFYVVLLLLLAQSIATAQIAFTPVDTNFAMKTIVLPKGYDFSTLFIGGVDSVVLSNGTKQLSKESQDLIIFIPKDGNSSTEGLLYTNHETSGSDANLGNGGGGTVMNIRKTPYNWEVLGSRRKVDFTPVGGTSNNCAGNLSPKGSVFSAEETVPTSNPGLNWGNDTADFSGYKRYLNVGFMVEIDAQNAVALRKCYAMGRYAHEGCAFAADHRTAYLTEDATPACLFKFVADNADDYSSGQLSVYKQSADGQSGTWLPIPRNRDSLNITKAIALRLGATMFLRLEDCEIGPDGNLYAAETGNDNANLASNEAAGNKPALHLEPFRVGVTSTIRDTFGRIIKLDIATGKVTNFLQGGKGSDGITCVSNPDNIAFDVKRNVLHFHEDINGTTGGRSLRNLTTCENYAVDMNIANPTVNDCKRFLVCPTSGEATGIWFTPDYETYFVNIQHPSSSDFFPFSKTTTIAITTTGIKTKDFIWKNPPFLGTTQHEGIPIYYGALSGLDAIPGTSNGFMSLTDRGPNVDADNINGGNAAGVFPFPGFNPVIYELRTEGDSIRMVSMLPFKNNTSGPVSGLPLPPVPGGTALDPSYLDISKTPAPSDLYGIDCEGIVPGLNKDYYISEEYGPSIWNVDAKTGRLIQRYTPYPYAGQEVIIDSVFKKRRNNRGFECIAFTPKGKVYAMLQSPAYNPNSSAGDASQIHRIVEIDPATGKTQQFAYLHQPKTANLREKDWKMGDMTAINDYEFLVIEQANRNGEDSHKIYKIDLRGATPIVGDNFGGKTLEQLVDTKGLAGAGITPVKKSFFLDLAATGYDINNDKAEGLTIINDSTIAVCNDNDFGITSVNVDGVISASGKKSHIYIITLPPPMRLQNYVRITDRINPRLAATPRPLKFDSAEVGFNNCRFITLSNPGTNPVHIQSQYFATNDGDFNFTPLTGNDLMIAPGATKQLEVCFKPIQKGTRFGRLALKTDIPLTYETFRQDTSIIFVDLQGTGMIPGRLIITPTSYIDSSIIGKEKCHTVMLSNPGETNVLVTTASPAGSFIDRFTITGLDAPFQLLPGASKTFTICATPVNAGLETAEIDVEAMTNGKNIISQIPLGVYGRTVCATASPLSLFETKKIPVNTSDTETVTVTNCGEVAAAYTMAITADPSSAYSVIGSSTSAQVAPSSTTVFKVKFNPTVKDPAAATARISSSDITPITVALSGTTATVKVVAASPNVPNTIVGKTSPEFDVTVTNAGNINWTPGTASVTGPYTFSSGSTTAISPGAQADFKFTYTPTVVGTNIGSITFDQSSPTPESPVTIPLSGIGLSNAGVAKDENGKSLLVLGDNSPNPFSTTTTIRYSIGKVTVVQVKVFSIEGKEVATLVHEQQNAGDHNTTFDASALTSGNYVYSVVTEFGTLSGILTVQK
ncbi:MAG TPA: esterase-like activity of phytase family protein [Candidatus Kapabacteria bacterium]|nr:esterase-like activity of phytase family protein [Candidatus Kapabacteria bacterium]